MESLGALVGPRPGRGEVDVVLVEGVESCVESENIWLSSEELEVISFSGGRTGSSLSCGASSLLGLLSFQTRLSISPTVLHAASALPSRATELISLNLSSSSNIMSESIPRLSRED